MRMVNYTLSSSYYLVLKNAEVVHSQLPTQCSYQDGVFLCDQQDHVEIQIVYIVEDNINSQITLHIKKDVHVHIIETKIFSPGATFYKKLMIDEGANVHVFSDNQCINQGDVHCHEEIYLQKNALCQFGYAELSDGSFFGKYHYFLDGEGASAKVRMAVLSKKEEKKHYEVLIQHNQPYTQGQMDNYGVVKDTGQLIIDGIGKITEGQHGSAAHQTNKIMVFDPGCVASANPYLYIDEYDVKASHAAGVGKINEDHMYYLQSRGLTHKQAMHLITYGYLQPVIHVIDNDILKEYFEKALLKVGE